MNLEKMFETQKMLSERIGYTGEDKFEKDVHALLSELGELSKEWRGFKYWSKDQEPRTFKTEDCDYCNGTGVKLDHGAERFFECFMCDGIGKGDIESNPLLEEYVDGLHFVLELGIEAKCEWYGTAIFTYTDITNHFIALYKEVTNFRETYHSRHFTAIGTSVLAHNFRNLLQLYLGLGIELGFTLEQIEQAYYEKNKINHARQANGY